MPVYHSPPNPVLNIGMLSKKSVYNDSRTSSPPRLLALQLLTSDELLEQLSEILLLLIPLKMSISTREVFLECLMKWHYYPCVGVTSFFPSDLS